MQAQDVILLWRDLVNDPSSGGRWSDTTALTFLSEACQDLARDVEYPQGRYSDYTVPGQQEYPLTAAVIKYYRVYVGGQLIVPTSIDTLEGRQIQLYDQGNNGSGVPEHVPLVGGGGPYGDAGLDSPAWTSQQGASYPVQNVMGLPAPDAQPYTIGQRPRYYTRGLSVIGFVPTPLNSTVFTIDCLMVPGQVTQDTQTLIFPTNYKRALAWKMCELASFSDNSDRSSDQRQYSAQMYEKEMRKLRSDQKRGDRQRRAPKLLTYRSFYQLGNNRNVGSDEYP